MLRYFYFILFVAALLLPWQGQGQSRKADSLQNIIAKNKNDESHYMSLAALAEYYAGRKPDSAIFYGNLALKSPAVKPYLRARMVANGSLGYAHYMRGELPLALQDFKNNEQLGALRKDSTGWANAINNQGNVYIEMGNYAAALEKYRDALVILEAFGDKKGIAMANNNIGYIYKDLGDYDAAIARMLTGLRTMEALGDKNFIANNSTLLSAVYLRKKDYDRALSYQQRALSLYRELESSEGIAISLSMLANIYTEQGQYPAAAIAHQQAMALYRQADDKRQIASTHGYLGELLARQQRYAESIPYLDSSIALLQQAGNRRTLASAWLGQARNYIETRRLPAARPLLDSATRLILQTGNQQDLKSLYEQEARYHAALENYKTALHYAYLYTAQKDTLLNDANQKSINDLSIRYETEKKELQISLLAKEGALQQLQLRNQRLQLDQQLYKLTQNKLALAKAGLLLAQSQLDIQAKQQEILQGNLLVAEKSHKADSLQHLSEVQSLEIYTRKLQLSQRNTIIWSLAGLLLLAALLGYSSYRRSRLKAEARLQAAALQQQEQSAKAVIAAEEAERSRIARDLHDGLGQMMSATKLNLSAWARQNQFNSEEQELAFSNIVSLVDSSYNEIRSVSHNMMPNALLKNSLAAAVRDFVNQMDQRSIKVNLYAEGLENRLDSNTETVLYRVIQECVNNVIKHSGANTLDISLIRDAHAITATVEDNGRGFVSGKTGDGIGLKNIRTRMAFLKGTVDFSSQPGQGTLVALYVPL